MGWFASYFPVFFVSLPGTTWAGVLDSPRPFFYKAGETVILMDAPIPSTKLPHKVLVYRDLNGSLVTCEDADAIPNRMIGERIGVYEFARESIFRVRHELYDERPKEQQK